MRTISSLSLAAALLFCVSHTAMAQEAATPEHHNEESHEHGEHHDHEWNHHPQAPVSHSEPASLHATSPSQPVYHEHHEAVANHRNYEPPHASFAESFRHFGEEHSFHPSWHLSGHRPSEGGRSGENVPLNPQYEQGFRERYQQMMENQGEAETEEAAPREGGMGGIGGVGGNIGGIGTSR